MPIIKISNITAENYSGKTWGQNSIASLTSNNWKRS